MGHYCPEVLDGPFTLARSRMTPVGRDHSSNARVLGVPLVDNAYLEDAAREASARKRWEFLMTVQFTRIPGGTASSFNALATF